MPRISIVIAHQQDQRLEDTLLSVLENRPRDCEILVAHDGSYADPYQLADEVLFVETEPDCSVPTKLNEALYASCAPVVHVLAEGVTVSEGWCEGPAHRIARQHTSVAAPVVEVRDASGMLVCGLDPATSKNRQPQILKGGHIPAECAGPLLCAGFYSRRMLLGFGGFLETVDPGLADLDLALMLRTLNITSHVDASSVVAADRQHVQSPRNAGASNDLACLLVAHGQASAGPLAGLVGATTRLLANAVNPSQWACSIAWGMGLASHRFDRQVADRLAAARRTESVKSEPSISLHRAA